MAEIIRRIEEKDFQAVSDLYNGRKSVEELKWLYTDPEDPTIYNAFVAVNNDGEIIGEIAYKLSTYLQGDRRIKGAIPFNWKIIENYKGMAGILLFKKVLSLGDFSFAIGGTKAALNLFPLFKLQKKLEIVQFYKILKPIPFLKTLKRKSLPKTYGMFAYLLPGYFKNLTEKDLYHDVELIKYNGKNYSEEIDFDSVFRKETTKEYIDWLLSCPVIESYAFIIKKGNNNYGICVLYIQKTNNSKKRRIVHLPYLGDDKKLWNTIILKCTDFLRKKGCSLITAQSYHNTVNTAYSYNGFIKIDSHSHPLYLKDPKRRLRTFDLKNWHLQYSERDKSYSEF